jgi:hypothetical protein
MGVLLAIRHHENINRLIAGTESKLGGGKSVPAASAAKK